MRLHSDTIHLNWARDYLTAKLSGPVNVDSESLVWRDALSPFTNAIYSHPRNLFLSDGYLPSGTELWIRDGLLPLKYFFEAHRPEAFEAQFLVETRFHELVPEEWRPRVRFYQLKHVEAQRFKKIKKLIIIGCQSPAMGSLLQTTRVLNALSRKQGGLNWDENPKVQLWLPIKSPHFIGYPKTIDSGIERLYSSLSAFHCDIEFVDWPTFLLSQDLSDAHFCEVNSGNLVQETFCTHYLLSRGARRIHIGRNQGELVLSSGEDQTLISGAEFVQLSPYHGLEIQPDGGGNFDPWIRLNERTIAFLKDLEEVLNWENSQAKRIKKNIGMMGHVTPVRTTSLARLR